MRLRRRWFREVEGKQQIREEIRALCSFGRLNLVDDDQLSVVGEVDVILCRNVLIYFGHALRDRVVGLFHDSLVRFGVLALGLKESIKYTPYEDRFDELAGNARIYRRKA